MEKKKKSPQSQRLDEFRLSTGYSITEFSNQCQIKSPSTFHKVISEGLTPSPKILDKVIKRFPMLNHDWVVLGYGEMIVKGLQTQETGVNSLNKSNDSAYQYIIEALRDHDFALNTLSKNVEKAITQSDHETELLKIKVNEMANAIKEGQKFIVDKEAKRDAFFEKMHADELVKIESLDRKRLENIKKLDTERRENREAGQKKLSHKIYAYLKESRELIYSETRKSTEYALKEIKIALEEAKQQAIISSHENISEQFGKHTINKKD